MPVYNFPSNPTIGTTYAVGTTIYQWNGSAWLINSKPSTFNTTTVLSLLVTTSTNATSVNTGGAMTVVGGAAIGRDLYVGGNIIGRIASTSTSNFTKIVVNGGVQSVSTTTGDITVTGGIGIGGNLYIGGTLFSQGAPVLTTASFNNTPADGTDIDVVDIGGGILEFNNISTLQSVTVRGSTTNRQITITNTTVSTGTNTGALIVSGGIGSNGSINANTFSLPHASQYTTVTNVATTSPTVIDQYYFSQFRSAKYIIQVDEGTLITHRCQTSELLTVAFNTGTASVVEYATVFSTADLGNFSALMTNIGTDTVVSLYYIAADTIPKTIKIFRTAISK